MTYTMLLQILLEAEARRDDEALPSDVRQRSSETVELCNQRISTEGMTRAQLEEFAAAEA